MKYIIFFPIAFIYGTLIYLTAGIMCLWSFDFKTNFKRHIRNLDYKIGFGYWLDDRLN
jgi:hypothetical protein